MLKKLFGLALALLATLAVSAQVRVGEGQLSGSFESNSIYYQDDSGLGAAGTAPDDRFGSNNYMKLDYMNGRFSAGLQIDAYLPALQGYEIGQQPGAYHFYLSSKYIQWQDHNYSVRVGDIFDQFGSGLIFRSFEDRQLGFNNSIETVLTCTCPRSRASDLCSSVNSAISALYCASRAGITLITGEPLTRLHRFGGIYSRRYTLQPMDWSYAR